jgi:hypothetical protein
MGPTDELGYFIMSLVWYSLTLRVMLEVNVAESSADM